jgi:hypothetical protein
MHNLTYLSWSPELVKLACKAYFPPISLIITYSLIILFPEKALMLNGFFIGTTGSIGYTSAFILSTFPYLDLLQFLTLILSQVFEGSLM